MNHEPTFSSLPMETWTNVLENLDLKDLASAQQVCTTLNGASNARSVWISLIERYSEKYAATQYACLDKSVKDCTTTELKNRFLHWMRVLAKINESREQENMKPLPQSLLFRFGKLLDPQNQRVESSSPYLLRGGRWLLYALKGQGIFYCDLGLHSPTSPSKPVLLIQAPASSSSFDIVVDENHTSSLFRFTIAVVHNSVYSEKDANDKLFWNVYKGGLEMDKRGHPIGLCVEHISRFWPPFPRGSNMTIFSLLGSYLAIYISKDPYIAIFNWKEANEEGTFPWKLIAVTEEGNKKRKLWLLSGNLVLLAEAVYHSRIFKIYDLSVEREQIGLPKNIHLFTKPLVMIPHPGDYHCSQYSSSIFFTKQSYRLLFHDNENIYGVIIQDNTSTRNNNGAKLEWRILNLATLPDPPINSDGRTNRYWNWYLHFNYTSVLGHLEGFGREERPVYYVALDWDNPQELPINCGSDKTDVDGDIDDLDTKKQTMGFSKIKIEPRRPVRTNDVVIIDPTSGNIVSICEDTSIRVNRLVGRVD